jgi:hypothetical protein
VHKRVTYGSPRRGLRATTQIAVTTARIRGFDVPRMMDSSAALLCDERFPFLQEYSYDR